ncbi:tyrosine-protein phosphatase [Zhongshania sp.]|uniref:tyrosine-protein phosphatase n=1 Tax=Zhongshania sp. TaxID=1971902 RepID=UPI003562083C
MTIKRLAYIAVTLLFAYMGSQYFWPKPQTDAVSNAQPHTNIEPFARLLPLDGGSNFRDVGAYPSLGNKTVREGLLFRSASMNSLNSRDEAYLNKRNFKTVIDLRSQEEVALYPNPWVKNNTTINYINYPYSFMDMKLDNEGDPMKGLYISFPQQYQAQMRDYFQALLANQTPLVVNCSAGQDRTGFAVALLLSVLDVPREIIVQDYLLSTQYRRPKNEQGNVNLEEASKVNAFAKMMLRYNQHQPAKPTPLTAADGTPYINYAFAKIEQDYGNVNNYLEQALGVDASAVNKLKSLYLY